VKSDFRNVEVFLKWRPIVGDIGRLRSVVHREEQNLSPSRPHPVERDFKEEHNMSQRSCITFEASNLC